MGIFDQALTGVQTAINKAQNVMSGTFQQLQNKLQDGLNVIDAAIEGNNLSGFNISGLDTMKEHIVNLTEQMQTNLNDFATKADPEVAFRGGYTGDIKTYLEEAKNICNNIISYMGYYKDRIEVIKQNIETRTSSMSSEIRNEASAMSEENVQAYQAKY